MCYLLCPTLSTCRKLTLLYCLHARIVPCCNILIGIVTIKTLLVVDTPPCCRACFGRMSILHIKTTRKTYISTGKFLDDVGVHRSSIALIVGHEQRKWRSIARWSATAASTTSPATNGRQATLITLTSHRVCNWGKRVAFACECSAGGCTMSLATASSTCGAFRNEC